MVENRKTGKNLKKKVDVITITNHNNARSCFDLEQQGIDILTGAEFSCQVPDYVIDIHVLAYGFSKEQEEKLNKLRKNIYQFQRYTLTNDIPTIWAHPLYHYSTNKMPSIDFFNKMALIFERFEVLNGQRDTWQNMLVKYWIDTLTPEAIDNYAEQFSIDPKLYCNNPYKKSMSAGSDSHIGTFSGQTFTMLHIPNLATRLKTTSPTVLALEAIKNGDMAPQGTFQNTEKLTITFLDYFCQIALNKKDPGLMRVLLHRGTTNDKLMALIISNAFAELQHHRVTMKFIRLFHNCFTGRSPSRINKLMIPSDYKTIYELANKIAKSRDLNAEDMAISMNSSVNTIYSKLFKLLLLRVNEKVSKLKKDKFLKSNDLNELIGKLEIPSDLRTLIGKKRSKNKRVSNFNVVAFLDGLPFPFLTTSLILGANFTAAKVLYNSRQLLNNFSKKIGKLQHPERLLWLTDSFDGKNGVSIFLQQFHKEIKKRDLPIDILVCSNTILPDDHLIVVKPISVVKLPFYENQDIGIPDFIEIQNLFIERGYDRLVCSTEGIMGLLSIYLKHAFSVNAYFYIHTDWETFARKVMKVDRQNLSRVRRLLRAYYNSFDSLFVLNEDHKKWLTSRGMDIPVKKVYHTAHWVDEQFKPVISSKMELFGIPASSIVMLYAGRISLEKGVMELPEIYNKLRSTYPNLLMVVAGNGPALDQLKNEMPEAKYMGWVEQKNLTQLYSSSDLLILPSKFDTFGCVIIEAMSCGLPVLAYNTKGSKDIITHGENGFLAHSIHEMVSHSQLYFSEKIKDQAFRNAAISRAKRYNADSIISDFMESIGMNKD